MAYNTKIYNEKIILNWQDPQGFKNLVGLIKTKKTIIYNETRDKACLVSTHNP